MPYVLGLLYYPVDNTYKAEVKGEVKQILKSLLKKSLRSLAQPCFKHLD